MKTTDYGTSLIRTIVPMLVGYLATLALRIGVEIDTAALELALVSIFSGLWYAAVRALEARYPRIGWLLGIASPPAYEAKHRAGA